MCFFLKKNQVDAYSHVKFATGDQAMRKRKSNETNKAESNTKSRTKLFVSRRSPKNSDCLLRSMEQ